MFRQQVVWFVLTASILFNVFFAAGYLKAQARGSSEEAAQAHEASVLRELKLDTNQAEHFKTLRDDFRQMSRDYRDGITLLQSQLLKEFSSGSPDPQVVEQLMERDADLHRERRLASLERMYDFTQSLSSDQLREFVQRMSERDERHRQRREHMFRRFDANGDGVISDEEHAAARSQIERRRRGHMHGPPGPPGPPGSRSGMHDHRRRPGPDMERIRQRFDLNGNGQLDPDERMLIHEQFDLDGDGWLSESERARMREEVLRDTKQRDPPSTTGA